MSPRLEHAVAIAAFALALLLALFVASVRGQGVKSTPLTPKWSAERQAEIDACRSAGGLPVVLAGVLASDGIGCAQPLGD